MEDPLEPDPARDRPRAAKARQGRATIFDVARVAGVSYSTVSRVVNGHEHIRDETRLRVQAAMAELGYVAHVSARTLATGRSRMVGLLVQEVESPFFLGVIRGVDQQVSCDRLRLPAVHHPRPAREGGGVRGAPVPRHGRRADDASCPAACRTTWDSCAPTRSRSCSSTTTRTRPGCNVINAANRDGTRCRPAATCWTWATDASGSSPARSRPAPRRSASIALPGGADDGGHPHRPGADRATATSWSRAAGPRPTSCWRCPSRPRRSSRPATRRRSGCCGRRGSGSSTCPGTCR